MTSSSNPAAGAAKPKWLSIVGIGEDGLTGLGTVACERIAEAEVVFGGARHLALAGSLIRGELRPWPSPFDSALKAVLDLRGRRVCLLASGDPFQYGVGGTLARLVDMAEVETIPAPSAFSLAAARLGWPLQETETLSLHGRPIALLRPLLHPRRRILALTSDGSAPMQIAALLTADGFGGSRLTVLEALGGAAEARWSATAADMGNRTCNPLNLLAIEVVADPRARVLPLGGLETAFFEHDGQITKPEIRAVTLAALAPRRGALLWDVGAGAGSIAVEWMLRHPSLAAIAIEAVPARAARIARNAEALGVPGLRVVEGAAPVALAGLPAPDAIFLGGGGTDAGVLEAVVDALPPAGRLVANAVTLEMQVLLTGAAARLGGELTSLAVARAAPIGGMTGWRPAMPVVQWTWVKP